MAVMKKLLYDLLLLILFSVVFSGLSACTKDRVSGPANSVGPKSSDFPMLADAIANAEVQNVDGSTFKISDLKGKVVLLNLWATWCGPCRKEVPTLVKLQDTYRDQGFKVVGLNADDGDTKDKIAKFADEMNVNYTLAWADMPLQNSLLKISQFTAIPQSFLVDREGRLRGVFRGGGQEEIDKMQEIVGKLVAGQAEDPAVGE